MTSIDLPWLNLTFLSLLLCLLSVGHAQPPSSPNDLEWPHPPQVLQQCSDERCALHVLGPGVGWDEDLSVDGASADVLFLLKRGWWPAAKELLRHVRAQSPGTDLEPARRYLSALRDDATSALALLRVNTAEDTILVPAFQWAQSLTNVFINVKFSSRMDGPTTVLNVVNENVTIGEDSLSFSALGKDKPKRIRLHIQLAHPIDPQASSWSFNAVGRVGFTLRKADASLWPQLLAQTSARPKNMSPWLDRQEQLDVTIRAERRQAELTRTLESLRAPGVPSASATPAASGAASDSEQPLASPPAAASVARAPRQADDEDDDDDHLPPRPSARVREPDTVPASVQPGRQSAQELGQQPAPALKEGKQDRAGSGGKGQKKAKARRAEPPPDVRSWNSTRVLSWLDSLSLGHCKRHFARHEMDGLALAQTSEDEMRAELGLTTVGERKRLRIAICRAHPRCTMVANVLDAWSETDVARWLAQHGLGAHEPTFRSHRIDGPALLELSDEELKTELRMRDVRERKVFRVRLCEASSECELLATEIAEWSEPQVVSWLETFGYGRQSRRFKRRRIDGLALLELTDSDLKDELGVWALGPRKRFGQSLCAADERVCPAVEGQPDQFTSS